MSGTLLAEGPALVLHGQQQPCLPPAPEGFGGSAVLRGAVALELGGPWSVPSSSEPRIPAGTGGRFPVWGRSESSRDNRSAGWPGAIGSLRGDERNTIFCLWPYYERLGLRNSCFSHIIALDKS